MFKYFISASKRKGSCYFEFSVGCCEEDITKHLQIESIYIAVPDWFNTNLEATIAHFCPKYEPFGSTTITKEQWTVILHVAQLAGGELREVASEASEWANQVFLCQNAFTILGPPRSATLPLKGKGNLIVEEQPK